MLDMATIPAAASARAVHLDVGVPLTSAARHELGVLTARTVLAARRAEARRDRREAARRARRRAELAAQQQAQAAAPVAAVPMATGDPQQIAAGMLGAYGWGQDQFGCLDALWSAESGWNVYAANPSGAYGIPQALPGSKMSSAGPDWQNDAATQIRWGLGYIAGLYGSPCGAESHEQATGWY